MSTTPKLSPTIFLPPGSADLPPLPAEAEVARAPAPRADEAELEHDADLIAGVSLTFNVLPLGGAKAAMGFEPFALP